VPQLAHVLTRKTLIIAMAVMILVALAVGCFAVLYQYNKNKLSSVTTTQLNTPQKYYATPTATITLTGILCIKIGNKLICKHDPPTPNLLLILLYFGLGSWINYVYLDKGLCLKLTNGTCITLPQGQRLTEGAKQYCGGANDAPRKFLFNLEAYVPVQASAPPDLHKGLVLIVGNETCTSLDNRLLCSKYTVIGSVLTVEMINSTTIEIHGIVPLTNYTNFVVREIAIGYNITKGVYLLLLHDYLTNGILLNQTMNIYYIIKSNTFIAPLLQLFFLNYTLPNYGSFYAKLVYQYIVYGIFYGNLAKEYICANIGYSASTSDLKIFLKLYTNNGTYTLYISPLIATLIIKNVSNTLIGILGSFTGKCNNSITIYRAYFGKNMTIVDHYYKNKYWGWWYVTRKNLIHFALPITFTTPVTIPCNNGVYVVNLVVRLRAG